MFVNRRDELAALERWWAGPEAGLALVWGRRRVGKTALIGRFATGRRTIFHTGAARPAVDELRVLSRAASGVAGGGLRDLGARPFADFDDAIEAIAALAADEPLLLVLDEFPELVRVTPELPSVLRALWDRLRGRTALRILLCGSAVRTMEALRDEREPLYGRFGLMLPVHPFRPHESAELLTGLSPADRALVWGVTGGMPPYLSWWDQEATITANLARLVCTPGGLLLTEGQLILATEVEPGGLPALVLRAIAAGRTKHNEIEQAVRAEPGRTLERLVELRLVERMVPVTDDQRRSRRRLYRIADNFLAFWLGIVEPYRTEIERGLGRTIVRVIEKRLDDHMGPRFEEAFRDHLRARAVAGDLGPDVVAIGAFWTDTPPTEIDAVALSGVDRRVSLAGEAKWSRSVSGPRLAAELRRKTAALPLVVAEPTLAIAARDEVRSPDGLLAITARDIFATSQ